MKKPINEKKRPLSEIRRAQNSAPHDSRLKQKRIGEKICRFGRMGISSTFTFAKEER